MTGGFLETLDCENPLECEEWYSIFKRIDVDNDGLIPMVELGEMFRSLQYQFNLDERMMKYFMINFDRNKDSMIDFTEFTSLMLRAKKMNMHRLMLYAARSVIPRTQKTEVTRYILHYSCIPPPFFLLTISLLQIIVYLYYVIETGVGFSLTKPAPVNSTLILNPYKKLELWRYFTYMFIHIGYSHLLTNLAVQILLGVPLELVHKFWRIGLIYILGGISGALLFFAFHQNYSIYLAGASGGVYALLSAHIANVIINWNEMDFNWLRTSVLCIFIGADVGSILYKFYVDRVFTKVSNISHLGGFIAGLLLGIVILRNLKKLKLEAYVWWISLALFIFYISTCIILIAFPF